MKQEKTGMNNPSMTTFNNPKLQLLIRASNYWFARRNTIMLESTIKKWIKKLKLDYQLDSVYFSYSYIQVNLTHSQIPGVIVYYINEPVNIL